MPQQHSSPVASPLSVPWAGKQHQQQQQQQQAAAARALGSSTPQYLSSPASSTAPEYPQHGLLASSPESPSSAATSRVDTPVVPVLEATSLSHDRLRASTSHSRRDSADDSTSSSDVLDARSPPSPPSYASALGCRRDGASSAPSVVVHVGGHAVPPPRVLPPPPSPPPSYTFTVKGIEDELRDLIAYVQLSPEEVAARVTLGETVTSIVTELWPERHPRCEFFGSFRFGLALPNSDLDMAVFLDAPAGIPAHDATTLESLQSALEKRGFIAQLFPGRVPIVRFWDPATHVCCDLTLCPETALDFVESQRRFLETYPCAVGLATVTKVLLKQWNLNSVHTGGLSSASLYLLIERFLVHSVMSRSPPGSPAPAFSLALLTQFWEHLCIPAYACYGYQCIDRHNPHNDVSRGTRCVVELQTLLRHAMGTIHALSQSAAFLAGGRGGSSGSGSSAAGLAMPATPLAALFVDPRVLLRRQHPPASAAGGPTTTTTTTAPQPSNQSRRKRKNGGSKKIGESSMS